MRKQHLLVDQQEAIAPVDHGAQRLLAQRQVARPDGQQTERAVQPFQQRRRRELLDPNSCQFKRQW
ncbi:MAG: hypothetical protein ACJ8CR_37690 [Roseiflexaceae bacterium]